MLLKYCTLAERLELDLVDVELELRFKVLFSENFKAFKPYTITYYRNIQYPNITFRSFDGHNIESKELVERTKYKGANLVLSIEQKNIDIDVVPSGLVRKIERCVVQRDPLVEVVYENGEYLMEIEFTRKHIGFIDSLIKQYKCKWWPSLKPMEVSLLSLSRKLSTHIENYTFSHKADGLHFVMFDDVVVYDSNTTKIYNPKTPRFVYEGEMVDGNPLLYDCLVYNYKNISKLPYPKRWEHIKGLKKPIYNFKTLEELRSWCYMPPPFKSDGHIISSTKKVYKSKWISTIDLRYISNCLYLEGEIDAYAYTHYNLKDGHIYEFEGDTLKLLRERPDKTVANYKWVGESNQLYKYAFGIGIPSVRVAHNKLKLQMLDYMKGSVLLDIGSGKGGDYDKWIHLGYKKVYALDPQLQLRKHHYRVTEIRESTKTLTVPLEYDSISIFFVPWDDSFIPYILKAKYFAISYMIPPDEDLRPVYSIKNLGDTTEIIIPDTSTASHIIEQKTDYEKIFKDYLSDWSLKEFKIGIYKECIEYNLSNYYKHFVFTKNE